MEGDQRRIFIRSNNHLFAGGHVDAGNLCLGGGIGEPHLVTTKLGSLWSITWVRILNLSVRNIYLDEVITTDYIFIDAKYR